MAEKGHGWESETPGDSDTPQVALWVVRTIAAGGGHRQHRRHGVPRGPLRPAGHLMAASHALSIATGTFTVTSLSVEFQTPRICTPEGSIATCDA